MSPQSSHAPAVHAGLAVVEAHASFLAALRAGGASSQSLRVHDQALSRFAEYLRPRTLIEATSADARAFAAYLVELGVTPSSLTAYGTVLTRWLAHLDGAPPALTAPPPIVIACDSLVDSEVAPCLVPVVAVEPEPPSTWRATPATLHVGGPAFEKVEMPADAFAFVDDEPQDRVTRAPSSTPAVEDAFSEASADDLASEPPPEASPSWMAPPPMKFAAVEEPAPTERLEVTGNDEAAAGKASVIVANAGDDAPSWNDVAHDDEEMIPVRDAHPVQDFSRSPRAAPALRGGSVDVETWSVQVTGSVMTDLTLVAVRNMAQRGELSEDTRVRRADGKWMRAGDYGPLRHVLEEAHLARTIARGQVGRGLSWSIGGALVGALVAALGAWFAAVALDREASLIWILCGPVVAWITSRIARPSKESGIAAAAGTLVAFLAAQYCVHATITAGVGTRAVEAHAQSFGAFLFTATTLASWGMAAIGCGLAFLLGRWRR